VSVLGPEREAAVCRELSKRFEEVRRGSLGELADAFDGAPPKGEIVVLIGRGDVRPSRDTMDQALAQALQEMTVKDAAKQVAADLGLPRRDVYQAALALTKGPAK
jgi:16S rRNA (cytidine1402-2'-O)-methyltransferase